MLKYILLLELKHSELKINKLELKENLKAYVNIKDKTYNWEKLPITLNVMN